MIEGQPGEVPGAVWVPAHMARYKERPQAQGGAYREVTIHITSGHADPYGPARRWQQPAVPPAKNTAAHFVVGQLGQVLQCVPLRFAAQHAHDVSAYSVGIEHSAREPGERGFPKGDPGLPPTFELYASSAHLVAYLLKAAGLLPVKGITIKGHAEADPKTTHRGCPDAAPWDWQLYMQLVVNAFESLGAVQPLVL